MFEETETPFLSSPSILCNSLIVVCTRELLWNSLFELEAIHVMCVHKTIPKVDPQKCLQYMHIPCVGINQRDETNSHIAHMKCMV